MKPDFDIVIVGSGPAGVSTAINIVRLMPTIKDRLLVLEKAVHPRQKPCGGGITPGSGQLLNQMGIELMIDIFDLNRSRVILESGEMVGAPFRTVFRSEFDDTLVKNAVQKQIRISQDEKFLSFLIRNGTVIVTTNKRQLTTYVLIGADGTNSVVRKGVLQSLGTQLSTNICKTLQILLYISHSNSIEHQKKEAIFDFKHNFLYDLMGYSWSFPYKRLGKDWLNLGIIACNFENIKISGKILLEAFQKFLQKKNIELKMSELKSAPVRWFHPDSLFSTSNVLLVGDAAGVDPLVADGIFFSLGYGIVAAESAKYAIENNDFSFSTYKNELLQHVVGKTLLNRLEIAREFYLHRKAENFINYLSLKPALEDI